MTVTYDGALTRTLSHCYSCTATYLAVSDTAQVGFQVEDGYTQFDLSFFPEGTGYRIQAVLQELNMEIPAKYYGGYYEPAYLENFHLLVADSCVKFSSLELRAGGKVAGSINNCLFRGGDADPMITAAITGTFSATFRQ